MGRIILGVVAGFVVWSIVWVVGDLIVAAVWPEFARSLETLEFTTPMLLVTLVRSVVTSVIAGFAAVLISKEFSRTAWGLGILLLLTGILVQGMFYWDVVPLWYNLLFWLFLVPATVFGGKLAFKEGAV